jgi:hypothetical protein
MLLEKRDEMILYERYKAPPEFRLRFHFRDKFGNDIKGAREYDPETGTGRAVAPGTESRPTVEEEVLVPFFKPHGYVEIDGHTNPSQETLDKLFATADGKAVPDKATLDKTVKMSEQDVRFNEQISER